MNWIVDVPQFEVGDDPHEIAIDGRYQRFGMHPRLSALRLGSAALARIEWQVAEI